MRGRGVGRGDHICDKKLKNMNCSARMDQKALENIYPIGQDGKK